MTPEQTTNISFALASLLLGLVNAAPALASRDAACTRVHLAIDFATAFYKDDECSGTPYDKRTIPAFQCVNLGSRKYEALAVTPNATFTDDNGSFYNANTLIYPLPHCKGKPKVLGIDATVPNEGCEAFDEGQIKFLSYQITTTTPGPGDC